MSVAGIDFSSKAVDVVFLNEDGSGAEWTRYDLTGIGDSFDACRRVRDVLPSRGWWEDEGVLAIGIEKPYSRSWVAGSVLMRLQGAILACLPTSTLLAESAPATWKKQTVGSGNADKGAVALWALERCQAAFDEDWPQDALDAYCIAYALRERLVRSEAA